MKTEFTKDDVKIAVISIISDTFLIVPDEIELTSTWEDLDIDSLGQVQVVIGLEEIFDITIQDTYIDEMHNVNDIIMFCERLLRHAGKIQQVQE